MGNFEAAVQPGICIFVPEPSTPDDPEISTKANETATKPKISLSRKSRLRVAIKRKSNDKLETSGGGPKSPSLSEQELDNVSLVETPLADTADTPELGLYENTPEKDDTIPENATVKDDGMAEVGGHEADVSTGDTWISLLWYILQSLSQVALSVVKTVLQYVPIYRLGGEADDELWHDSRYEDSSEGEIDFEEATEYVKVS